ncbi:hypothetical protein AB4Y45_12515 [Paraburkholderia sp. EG287A]|uniref:hypothetical protein n=1 Tax=unclassified Paraburkholderia TaxID=2615204 RepID=UPI0034D33D0A
MEKAQDTSQRSETTHFDQGAEASPLPLWQYAKESRVPGTKSIPLRAVAIDKATRDGA